MYGAVTKTRFGHLSTRVDTIHFVHIIPEQGSAVPSAYLFFISMSKNLFKSNFSERKKTTLHPVHQVLALFKICQDMEWYCKKGFTFPGALLTLALEIARISPHPTRAPLLHPCVQSYSSYRSASELPNRGPPLQNSWISTFFLAYSRKVLTCIFLFPDFILQRTVVNVKVGIFGGGCPTVCWGLLGEGIILICNCPGGCYPEEYCPDGSCPSENFPETLLKPADGNSLQDLY